MVARDCLQVRQIIMADFNTLNEAQVADARATVIEAVKGLRSGDLPSDGRTHLARRRLVAGRGRATPRLNR